MNTDTSELQEEVLSLLRDWCGGLLRLQLDMPGHPEFDGAILCPSCQTIHGRCQDAVYPLLALARRTGDAYCVRAAERLFVWGATLLCDDGGLYNDAQSNWRGITAFNAIALHDALSRHGDLLPAATREAMRRRLAAMGEWLRRNIVPGAPAYSTNYFAANACAMALLGAFFDRDDFRASSRTLAGHVRRHFSSGLLLFGESIPSPTDARTPKGCVAVDVGGYNVEETLPCLLRYAEAAGDAETLDLVRRSYRAHLDWMLPDGAWDNSVGTRNYKWTYWGGRTSDGCQEALFRLGREDPVFAEAALRNLRLYRSCTAGGLLHGGPHFVRHGEPPCVHHSFSHARALAGALDAGIPAFAHTALPSDAPPALVRIPETDTLRLAVGDWRADVTAYDFDYMRGGHASGGALSLLWHRRYGPVVAVGTVDYSLKEPNNQQLSRKFASHRSLCPRIELVRDGRRWGQHYDFGATIRGRAEPGGPTCAHTDAWLCDIDHARLPGGGPCALDYALGADGLRITGNVPPALAADVRYILPIVADEAEVAVETGAAEGDPARIFNLCPGFEAREFIIRPDAAGRFVVRIAAPANPKAAS